MHNLPPNSCAKLPKNQGGQGARESSPEQEGYEATRKTEIHREGKEKTCPTKMEFPTKKAAVEAAFSQLGKGSSINGKHLARGDAYPKLHRMRSIGVGSVLRFGSTEVVGLLVALQL